MTKICIFILASSKPDPLEVGDIFRLNQDISSSSEINTRRSTLNLPKVIQWFLQTSKKIFVYFWRQKIMAFLGQKYSMIQYWSIMSNYKRLKDLAHVELYGSS